MISTAPSRLRFVTYLAPSIPEAFYKALADLIGERVGIETELVVDGRRSGPQVGDDPFSAGLADVGFMCAPCYLDLCHAEVPPVELLVAPVYTDPRNEGRPVYFSEVVVRRDARFSSVAQLLREGGWAYNDEGSLSGYFSMLRHPEAPRAQASLLSRAICSGSHLESLAMVTQGVVDGAAIDANVLALRLDVEPGVLDALRVLETLGPHPVQPVVIRSDLDPNTKDLLRTLFLEFAIDDEAMSLLAHHHIHHFTTVSHTDYETDTEPDFVII